MSPVISAKHELDILIKSSKPGNRPLIEPFIPEILAIVNKFGRVENCTNETGAHLTASALAGAIKALCLSQPICPVTGIPEEWVDISGRHEHELWQNNRCGALFKDKKDGQAHYLDAICWRDQVGHLSSGAYSWLGKEKIWGRQYVKFPFTPKTFVIDVISTEVTPDDWESTIKDPRQLDEVFAYYNKYKSE